MHQVILIRPEWAMCHLFSKLFLSPHFCTCSSFSAIERSTLSRWDLWCIPSNTNQPAAGLRAPHAVQQKIAEKHPREVIKSCLFIYECFRWSCKFRGDSTLKILVSLLLSEDFADLFCANDGNQREQPGLLIKIFPFQCPTSRVEHW